MDKAQAASVNQYNLPVLRIHLECNGRSMVFLPWMMKFLPSCEQASDWDSNLGSTCLTSLRVRQGVQPYWVWQHEKTYSAHSVKLHLKLIQTHQLLLQSPSWRLRNTGQGLRYSSNNKGVGVKTCQRCVVELCHDHEFLCKLTTKLDSPP